VRKKTRDVNEIITKIRLSNVADLQSDVQIKLKKLDVWVIIFDLVFLKGCKISIIKYTVKKFRGFPVPSQDVTYQSPPWPELI
jgi:hypothetical protein